jgi:hypothetical protein
VPEVQNNEQGRELRLGSTLSNKSVFGLGILLAIVYLAGLARVSKRDSKEINLVNKASGELLALFATLLLAGWQMVLWILIA